MKTPRRQDARERHAEVARRNHGAPRSTSVLGVLASWRLGLLLLSGCAYYNGMYNAAKFTKDALRSERAGRPAEARDRWLRAAIHAESVVARHPNSRWADDARLAHGRALLHLEQWSDAVVALREAATTAGADEQRLEALLLLGEANIALRRYPEADGPLDAAAASSAAPRRARALLARGRLRLARRDAAGALQDFAASGSEEAPLWSARAALALGDAARAVAELGRVAEHTAPSGAEADWRGLLDTLAQSGAADSASSLTDALVQRRRLSTGVRARLLLADGARLARRGSHQAAASRFRAAAALAPDSAEARVAELRLALLELDSAVAEWALDEVQRTAESVVRSGGSAAREAEPLLGLLARLHALARDSGEAGDARWFARAERIRDSLGLRRYAAIEFAAMGHRFPASPYTPKGLIAALAEGHPASDSLVAVLRDRYAESPYVTAAAGRDAERYVALEDSLRSLLQLGVDSPVGEDGDTPARTRPGARPRPADEPGPRRPAATPRPVPGAPRNPEP